MCVHTLAHVQYILILLSAKIQSQVQETKYKLVWPYWHLMYAYPESLDLTQRHVPFLVQYIYACRLQCLLQFILWQGMFHFENERFEDKYRLLPGSRDLGSIQRTTTHFTWRNREQRSPHSFKQSTCCHSDCIVMRHLNVHVCNAIKLLMTMHTFPWKRHEYVGHDSLWVHN